MRLKLTMLGLAVIAMTALASAPLSVASRLLLSHRPDASIFNSAAVSTFQAFIAVNDIRCLDDLQRQGVVVDAVFDGFVSARVPLDRLPLFTSHSGVSFVSLAQPVHLCNDSSRYYSNVDLAQVQHGHLGAFNGQGVIVGVIDTGIDFNHINFCDSAGRSRIRAVYLPVDSTGRSPLIDGYELPGSCYENPSNIALLKTDDTASSHGTHTLGTAAGSYKENGWHGVACDADIVACGMPEQQFTDVNIANAVKYIFDYADRVGKPCVINMSIGSNSGPNDGTSFLCRVFSSLSGAGRVCVLSAGNDGEYPVCFRYQTKFDVDTATTFLRNRWGGLQRQGYVSMWNNSPREHRTRVVIVNRSTGALEYASPVVGTLPEDSIFTISSEWDPAFAAFYTGELYFASGLEPQFDEEGNLLSNQRFHSIWEFDVESVQPGHLIGLQYIAETGTELVGWCTQNAYFYSFGMPGATGGSSTGSISDLATTDDVISVGAYCSRQSYPMATGEMAFFDGFYPTDIASFSSFGPDENGLQRPDVCAPGAVVISSANRYDVKSDRSGWPASAVVDGVEYPYYPNKGTSMSTPAVTGAIALMLQANPALTAHDVREVLKRSSVKDEYVVQGKALQWGAGKLDVWAAVNDVINNTLMPGDVNSDGEVNIADVQAIISIILGSASNHATSVLVRADVDRNTEINISDINRVINIIQN